MSPASTRSYQGIFRLLLAAALAVIAIALVVMTYRWPLVGDAQIFHYSHFLMEHGFIPYRDIPDINMPGTYIIEGWAMHLFGTTDLAWRVYDFTLLGVLTLAMIVIALPYDWLAGLFAGVLFALKHISNGPWDSVERDEIMTVLIMVAYAFLFEALRRRKPWMLLAFGFSLGMASTVKPTVAPLGLVLLAMAAWSLRKKGVPAAPYVGWGVAGAAAAAVLPIAFLARYHAIGAFLYCVKNLTPFYAGMHRASALSLLQHALPFGVWIVLPFAVVVALVEKQWRNWERWAILVGIAFGAFSYFVQGKGYRYHTHPLVAFVFLWAAIELLLAMHSKQWTRSVGIAGLAAGIFIVIPAYVYRLRVLVPDNKYTVSLESDLSQMGGDRLNRQVQCLDLVYGCFDALYHLKLVQSTGNIGDLVLFASNRSPIVDASRERFWNEIVSKPPAVIVLGNEWFDHSATFNNINTWPELAGYVESNYQLVVERKFEGWDDAYRIYVRKGVPLPRPWNAG